MPFYLIIGIFGASFLVLARSSAVLVNSLTILARIFGISEYAIAFLLMSFATSIAELFIGISSAIDGVPELSLGNILGANLLNITIVIGIPAILAGGMKVESKLERRNFWFIFFLALFPFFLASDGLISRGDGIILLLGFISYIWLVMGEKEYFSKIYDHYSSQTGIIHDTLQSLIWLFLGTVFILISSAALVWSGRELIASFLVEGFYLGVIFVALGTTLPELAFGVRSALSQHGSMAIGNALGSIAFNAAFIVGIVGIIRPIKVAGFSELSSVFFAFIAAFVLFNFFIHRNDDISKKEAFTLMLIYFVFLFFEVI